MELQNIFLQCFCTNVGSIGLHVLHEKGLAAGPGGIELTSMSVSPASHSIDSSVCMYVCRELEGKE